MAQLKSTSVTGNLSVTGNVVASNFIKHDGLVNQFLMADGHVENAQSFNQDFILNNTNILGVQHLQLQSENFNDSGYDHIYVGNTNDLIKYRTKTQFIQDLELSQVYNYKGTLANLNALKSITSARVGDVYFLSDTGNSWACKQKIAEATGNDYETYWSNLGNNVDLSGYMTLDTNQTITGKKIFVAPSTGASTITSDVESLIITNSQQRIGTVGSYLSGIAFNHMWNWSGGTTYNQSAHAWIGLRLVSTPAAETSALVFATRSNTTAGERPIERMCVAPDGKIGIGTTSPTALLEVSGDIKSTGIVQASQFKSDDTAVTMRLSNNNEINFGSTSNYIYFGYENRTNSTQKVDTYKFGCHNGGADSANGNIECGSIKLRSVATFEYNTDDKCIDVKFN